MRTLLILLALCGTASASPDEPRGFVDGIGAIGESLGSPETVAGILGIGVRGGARLPDSQTSVELGVDAAQLSPPDPEGFDATDFEDGKASRVRALGGVRFVSPTRWFARLAFGAELVRASITSIDDYEGNRNSYAGSDVGPALEISGGHYASGAGALHPGLELALSYATHDGGYLGGWTLDYTATALELRFVLGFDL